jgi:hypothetical protein
MLNLPLLGARRNGERRGQFPGAPVAGPVLLSFIIVDGGRELRAIDTHFIVASFSAVRR